MSSSTVFHAIGDFLTWTFGIFEVIDNIFNYLVIAAGFFGLFFWLNKQRKFNAEAAANKNQIK
jgi:hypothetical protein